jgi:hypothetical protein
MNDWDLARRTSISILNLGCVTFRHGIATFGVRFGIVGSTRFESLYTVTNKKGRFFTNP